MIHLQFSQLIQLPISVTTNKFHSQQQYPSRQLMLNTDYRINDNIFTGNQIKLPSAPSYKYLTHRNVKVKNSLFNHMEHSILQICSIMMKTLCEHELKHLRIQICGLF